MGGRSHRKAQVGSSTTEPCKRDSERKSCEIGTATWKKQTCLYKKVVDFESGIGVARSSAALHGAVRIWSNCDNSRVTLAENNYRLP